MDYPKILIPVTNDPRKRYQFVSGPLDSAGIPVDTLDVKTFSGFISSVRTVSRCSNGIVIVVGFGVKLFIIALAAQIGGNKVVLRMGGDTRRDAREVIRSSVASGRYVTAIRVAINKCTLSGLFVLSREIVVVNESLINLLLPQAAANTRFFVVPQPVFENVEVSKRKAGEQFEILTVANFRYQRKAEGVIWQIERLIKIASCSSSPMRLRVAGDGYHLNEVRSFLDNVRLPFNLEVELLGFVSNVDSVYENADLFIYRSDHDVTPNVILEAKRWGLPIVVNNYGPFLNLVENEATGLVYADEAGFITAVLGLWEDEKFRLRLGAAGLSDFRKRYSVSAVGKEFAKVISSVVTERHVG